MFSDIQKSDLEQLRTEKLEHAKFKIDDIKAKVIGLEKELLEIKNLDKQFGFYQTIKLNRKDRVYRVDNMLFLGNLAYQQFPDTTLSTWEDAMQEAKKLEISSYSSWRLPTVDELEKLLTRVSLKNSKGDSHYILKDFLENIPTDSCFWTSTEENRLYAWVVDFRKGYDYWRRKTLKYHALYVHDIDVNAT